MPPQATTLSVSIPVADTTTHPSDPGLEEVLSDEAEDVDPMEDVTELTDSLLNVEDMMYGKTTDPDLLGFLSVSEEGCG